MCEPFNVVCEPLNVGFFSYLVHLCYKPNLKWQPTWSF